MTYAIMNDRQLKEFEATKECNFAVSPPGIGRFRCNAFVQQGHPGLVMRTITTGHSECRPTRVAGGTEGRRDDQKRSGHHGWRHRLG